MARRLAGLFLLFAWTALAVGCGGGGGGGGAFVQNGSGQASGPVASGPTGNLVLKHTLGLGLREGTARAVPPSITHFRITGLDLAGNVVFPTTTYPKAAQIVLDLPLETVRLRIEYLEGATVAWIALVDFVLAPGVTITVEEPEREEVTAALQSIVLEPASPSLAQGTDVSLSATGVFSDGTTQDLTASVAWSSADPAVATVSSAGGTRGLAHGVAAGSVAVRADLGPVRGETTLTVTSAQLVSLQIAPARPSLPVGTTLQLAVTGLFTDGTQQDLTAQAAWSSATPGTATVTAGGLLSALAEGNADVTAGLGGVSTTAQVAVTDAVLQAITLTPASPSLARGTQVALTATGSFSDGTTQDLTTSVTWSSDSGAVGVSNATGGKGLVSGLAVGASGVSATRGLVTGTTQVTVTAATLQSITVEPASPALPLGTSQAFTATGLYSDLSTQDLTAQVTWSSSSAGLPISSGGVATATAPGPSTVAATHAASGISGSTVAQATSATLSEIQVSPATPTVALQTSVQMLATGVFSDGTTKDLSSQVAWSATAGTGTAAITARGLATGTGQGTSTLTATRGALSGSSTLLVTAAELVSIAVEPPTPALALGAGQAFTATGTFTDGTVQDLTAQVGWQSTVTSVATLTGPGLATVGAGQTVVRATLGGVSGQTTVTVTAPTLTSLAVTPDASTLAKGTAQRFTATATFSDGTTRDVTSQATWQSSSGAATISNAAGSRGVATGVSPGSPTITASLQGVSDTAALTVTAASVVSVTLTPQNPNLPRGTFVQFAALATFSDGTSQDVTFDPAVSWVADDAVVLQTTAYVTVAREPGQSTVRATLGGRTGTAPVTVTEAQLNSLTITPDAPSLAKGTSRALTATAFYSDGTQADLTSRVTWSSASPGVVSVSNAAGSRGIVTGVATGGPVPVSASFLGVTGNMGVTVTNATLDRIVVSPVEPTLPLGTTQPLTAMGVFSDGSTQDVTSLAGTAWTSSATGRATVSATGTVTSVSAGPAVITATRSGVSGGTTVNVTDAALTSIAVTPANPSQPVGTSVQFVATGAYTDGSSRDLTSLVNWSSSNAGQASVSNAAGSRGRATANAVGAPTISASLSGVTGSTGLTVNSAVLVSIAVTPFEPSLPKGLAQPMTATGTYSDGSTADLTTGVTWSSNSANAVVSNSVGSQGRVTAANLGNARITATLGAVSGNTVVTVTDAGLVSLAITSGTGGAPNVPKNSTRQLIATGTYTDGTTLNLTSLCTWTSLTPAVITISDSAASKGFASAVSIGSATLNATYAGVTGAATANVVESTDLVDVSTANLSGNGSAMGPRISGNGSRIAFQSDASDLVAGDANGQSDIFVRLGVGTATPSTVIASLVNGGTGQGNGYCYDPDISEDGDYVAFSSFGNNLVAGMVAGAGDGSHVFRRRLSTNETLLVSPNTAVVPGADNSDMASISNNGRYIAYRSANEHLGVAANTVHIYRKDMQGGEVLISQGPGGNVQGLCSYPAISDDGNLVAFTTTGNAVNFLPGHTDANNGTFQSLDCFLRNVASGTTVLVSHNSASFTTTGNSGVVNRPAVSGDGTVVYFASSGTDHVAGDTNGKIDIFRYVVATGAVTRVSLDAAGGQSTGDSLNPHCSNDGRYVIFDCEGALVPGDTNGTTDVYVRDTVANTTSRVSVDPVGRQGNGRSFDGDIDGLGGFVTFLSRAPNLDTRIVNGLDHVLKALNPPPVP